MKKAVSLFITFALLALAAVRTGAEAPTVAGTWTLSTENLPLRLVLAQNNGAITGTLDYPHGAPFRLTGAFLDGKLMFWGETTGANFTVHIDGNGSSNADGSLAGTINAHFIELDDTHQVRRTRDQQMAWTAVRTPQR